MGMAWTLFWTCSELIAQFAVRIHRYSSLVMLRITVARCPAFVFLCLSSISCTDMLKLSMWPMRPRLSTWRIPNLMQEHVVFDISMQSGLHCQITCTCHKCTPTLGRVSDSHPNRLYSSF